MVKIPVGKCQKHMFVSAENTTASVSLSNPPPSPGTAPIIHQKIRARAFIEFEGAAVSKWM